MLPFEKPLREAAVLVPLLASADGEAVLFTRRAEELRHHAGQVSFPGGSMEPQDDSAIAAALRETHEEVGLHPREFTVIGELPTLPTVTGFEVTPVVATVPWPKPLTIDPVEVAEAFAVPLAFLADETNRHDSERVWEGVPIPMHEWHFDGHRIWGATGWMVKQLINLIEK
ncbi:MAG: CoA pyrophosphatase [Pseudomonadota bacterium]